MERKGLVCLLFLALAGLGSARAEEPVLLQVGVPITRELHAGEVHSFQVIADAGDYIRIEIDQEGVDVQTVICAPSGQEIDRFDSSIGRYATDVASLITQTSGSYRFEVSVSEDERGSYQMTLKAQHHAEREDQLRFEAEMADNRAFFEMSSAVLAVERWREIGDRQGESWALTRLGRSQIRSGKYQEGLASCEQALALHRLDRDQDGSAQSLYYIGEATRALGDRTRAHAAYQEAIAFWQELGQPASVARALIAAGRTHMVFNETEEARAAYEQAITISREARDRNREIDALNELGQLYIRLGQPQIAMDRLNSALELVRGTAKETDIRLSLGALYQSFGSPREALEHFAAALKTYQATAQLEKQASTLNNLGSLLLKLGAPEEAREFLLRGLQLCRSPRDRATVLSGIGRAEDQLGNLEVAQSRLEEALKLQESVGDTAGKADTLRLRGFLLLKMGDPVRAREAFFQSLQLMEQSGRRSTEASARRGLASAEAALGNLGAARQSFEEARKQAEEMGNVSEQALALAEAGLLEHKAGRLQESRVLLESALQLIESFQSEIGGESLRAQHFAKIRETYERYVDVLMEIHRVQPEAGLLKAAFEAAERSRARSLLEVLTRARIDTHDGDPKLMEREIKLRLELNAKASARMSVPRGPERETINKEIQALSAEYEILEAQLTNRYAVLTQPSIHISDVQELLDSETVLLEYLLGDSRSYLWVVSRDSLTSYELPARKEIEAMAQEAHRLLSSPSERDTSLQREALDRLSRAVIAPAVEGLAGKRLVIVADGALQYIPFAALPLASGEPEPGKPATQPLFLNHETVLLPSAAVLKEIRRVSRARPAGPQSLAIFADPSYGGSDPKPPAPPLIIPELTRAGLAPLTWSRKEANQISTLAAGLDVLPALGFDATRELAMSDRLSHFSILHFATHGYLDSDHPELSGLALATIDKDGHPLEGFLRLQDLYSMHLQADLVVLSGCDTGLGRDLRGEGLQSLTHGFLHAGASQVIASLWPVRDRAATEFMRRLYGAMLRDGMRPSAALRAAQIGMRNERIWSDPYFWAPFVAQGDWLAGADRADRPDTAAKR